MILIILFFDLVLVILLMLVGFLNMVIICGIVIVVWVLLFLVVKVIMIFIFFGLFVNIIGFLSVNKLKLFEKILFLVVEVCGIVMLFIKM